MKVKRGDIVLVDLGIDVIGSEVGKKRPCVVVQNNIGNNHSPTTIVCPISHREYKGQPTQVLLKRDLLKKGSADGVIMAEQIRTISLERVDVKVGELSSLGLFALNKALLVAVGVH